MFVWQSGEPACHVGPNLDCGAWGSAALLPSDNLHPTNLEEDEAGSWPGVSFTVKRVEAREQVGSAELRLLADGFAFLLTMGTSVAVLKAELHQVIVASMHLEISH